MHYLCTATGDHLCCFYPWPSPISGRGVAEALGLPYGSLKRLARGLLAYGILGRPSGASPSNPIRSGGGRPGGPDGQTRVSGKGWEWSPEPLSAATLY